MRTMGYSALGISLPVFVAHAHGLFEEHGVPVRMKGYPTAHPVVDGIVDEGLPFGGFIAFPIAFHRHLRARPLYYACAVAEDMDNPISFLLVREGVTIRSLEDLGGRRVGVLPTKAYREWLKLLAARHGLGYHQAHIDKTCKCMETCSALDVPKDRILEAHDVLPKETVCALRKGRVDAVFTNDPGATAAVRAGVARVFGERPILPSLVKDPLLFGSFVFDSALVGEEPECATRIASALDEAIHMIRRDPDAARRAASAYLPADLTLPDDGLGRPRFLTSGEVRAAELQEMADLLAREGVIGGRIEVGPWIVRAGEKLARRPELAAAARERRAEAVGGCGE